MSWTDLETIRKHLQETFIPPLTITDEPLALIGTRETQLQHTALVSESERVKTIDLASPYSNGFITLSGTNWQNLTHAELVPDSAVVAADPALDTVYIEGTDYVLDYELGKLKRVTGSSIPDGATVYVWYFYYTVQTRNVD
jgi:hypothetical protein